MTLTADFIGRTLLDTRPWWTGIDLPLPLGPSHRPTSSTTRTEVGVQTSNVSLLLATAGLKINPVGNLLVIGNVLFKIGDKGLQDDITPVLRHRLHVLGRYFGNSMDSIAQAPPRWA